VARSTLQPAFLATQIGDQVNVTGNGTPYTVTFTSVVFDQLSNFDGTSTFTTPFTGKYLFSVNIYVDGIDAIMTAGLIEVVTTNATYRLCQFNPANVAQFPGGIYILNGTCIADMNSGDTAIVKITFVGSGATVSVRGNTTATFRAPTFSGYLVC